MAEQKKSQPLTWEQEKALRERLLKGRVSVTCPLKLIDSRSSQSVRDRVRHFVSTRIG